MSLTQKQIDYTIKQMIQMAISQIEECDEPESAVETMNEIIEIMEGDTSLVCGYWINQYYDVPLEIFSDSDIEIIKSLGLMKDEEGIVVTIEKKEEQGMCKYCKEVSDNIPIIKGKQGMLSATLEIEWMGVHRLHLSNDNDHITIGIRFCPMCGRKLG